MNLPASEPSCNVPLEVALSALATCDRVVAHLDAVASEQHAKVRAEQAQRIEAARVARAVAP